MNPVLIVVSMLKGDGASGVETHINAIVERAAAAGVSARFMSAQTDKDWRRRLQGVRRRALSVVDRERAHCVERDADAGQLERKLRAAFRASGGAPVTVYAQDPLSARAAMRARGGRAVRIVMTVHFNVSEAHELAERGLAAPNSALWEHTAAIERDVLSRVDHLIFVSAFMRDIVIKREPRLAGRPSSLIPNFCVPPLPGEARSGDGAFAGDLLAIGTLEPRKNQQFLLEVLAACRQRGKVYSCAIVGHGPDEEILRVRAEELGVADQVRFLGFVHGAASLIPSYRVLVHGARMENLPITLIEALACGRPVMAGAVGGIPEVIEHGVHGFLWPLDDPRAAAAQLMQLLDSPEAWAGMSTRARHRYEGHFSAQALGPRWMAAILGRAGA